MTTEQIIGLTLALLIMMVGIIGTLVPGIPGAGLVLIASIAHRLYFGPHGASNWILAGLVLLTGLCFVVEYLSEILGARKLGATWRGVVGAITGGLVGLFFSIPGILLGPFIGATLFELAGGRKIKPAAKAGAGATLGLLVGAVGKISICVAMVILFTVNVIFRSGT